MASCFRPFFSRLPTTTFFNLLRSSVHHTTLASILGVHKGFRQPSFKGAVGHDMTDIRHRKARAIPVFTNSLVLAFLQFAAFIIRKTKAGREFKTATLKGRYGTWINGYYYSLQHLCFLFSSCTKFLLSTISLTRHRCRCLRRHGRRKTPCWQARYAWVGV